MSGGVRGGGVTPPPLDFQIRLNSALRAYGLAKVTRCLEGRLTQGFDLPVPRSAAVRSVGG